MFGKDFVSFKGHRTGVTGALCRQLKNRQRSGDLLLTYVNEFRTSKICYSCNEMSFAQAFIGLNSVLACQSCGMIWQHGVNVSKNIFKISKEVISGRGRPQAFCKSK